MIADLNDAQLVSFDELAAAVARGEAAAQTFAGSSLSDTAAVRSLGKAYAELCALAEAFMLTDPAAYGGKLFTQQALAKTALRSAAAASRRKDLNVVAARWLQHERRPHQGVVFTARVLDLRARGAWTEYDLEIDYGSQTLRVAALLDKVKFGAGAEVGVIGLILPDPQRQLAGYDGDAAPLILVGDAFHPAKAAEAVGAPDEFELMAQ